MHSVQYTYTWPTFMQVYAVRAHKTDSTGKWNEHRLTTLLIQWFVPFTAIYTKQNVPKPNTKNFA